MRILSGVMLLATCLPAQSMWCEIVVLPSHSCTAQSSVHLQSTGIPRFEIKVIWSESQKTYVGPNGMPIPSARKPTVPSAPGLNGSPALVAGAGGPPSKVPDMGVMDAIRDKWHRLRNWLLGQDGGGRIDVPSTYYAHLRFNEYVKMYGHPYLKKPK